IGMIGSVAGDRGRRANYVYGASKALMDRYAQGLQHRFAGSGVKIVLIKPGPTDTPMTAQYKAQGRRLASVESVAQGTVDALERGTPIAYLPRKWQLIMFVVRALPDFIFNRLNI
ncbi:MAG: SDR family NAD(P)-dependent oxidoreductase, partial [Rhodospirillales bacterium]|nr:SDR family NAD(P)-dependent oxidoreductase [Rhodospirillales bacterium]